MFIYSNAPKWGAFSLVGLKSISKTISIIFESSIFSHEASLFFMKIKKMQY